MMDRTVGVVIGVGIVIAPVPVFCGYISTRGNDPVDETVDQITDPAAIPDKQREPYRP